MRWNRGTAAWLVFAAGLPMNLVTMNRTIGFVDRGELALAAWTFGIPHPTGYPTLMLLAGAIAHLVPLRPVLTLNALAAVLTAIGAAVHTLLLDRVLAAAAGAERLPARARHALAALMGLVTATSLTWWLEANGFEVYALHTVMMPLVVLTFLGWLDAAAAEGATAAAPSSRRAGFAFALVTGLSFTNHASTVLLAPGLVAAATLRLGPSGLARRIPGLIPAFALGLFPLVWLPIRAAMHPALDWGHPDTAGRFFRHVTAAQYRSWMFSDFATFATQLRFVLWRLPQDFCWAGVVPAALGAWQLARRDRALATLGATFVLAGVVFAAGYQILDLDSYLLTACFGLSLLVAAGLARLGERFGARPALVAAAALVAGNLVTHAHECDESRFRMAEDRVHDLLGPMPPRTLYLTSFWDIDQSPALYVQEVEGFRRDVVVVSPETCRQSWYVEDLARRAPGLVAPVRRELEALIAAEKANEAGAPVETRVLRADFDGFLAALVRSALRDRAVCVVGPYPWLPGEARLVPDHLAYRVQTGADVYLDEGSPRFAQRPSGGRTDADLALASWHSGETRLARARYETAHGRPDLARRALRDAEAFDPHVRLDELGPMPLASQDVVTRCAVFYGRLRNTVEQLASAD